MLSKSSSSFIEPGTFLPMRFFRTFMGGGGRSTCRRVSCAVAGHDHPHLPKGQIFGKNGVPSSVDALLSDEFFQLDYVHTPGWLDYEW
jgi:hypothetical protein